MTGTGADGVCYLRYFPWSVDQYKGLDHQSASLSCALAEALALQRTLIVPDYICIPLEHVDTNAITSPHTPRNASFFDESMSYIPCELVDDQHRIPIERLFDMELLGTLVPIVRESQLNRHISSLGATRVVDWHWSTQRIRERLSCRSVTVVQRRAKMSWFRSCGTFPAPANVSSLLRRIDATPHPAYASAPLAEHLLKSGIFFAPHIKAAAAAIRALIGANYVSVHVRRGDRLLQYNTESSMTEPASLLQSITKWFPHDVAVYIGSNEKPDFWAPLQARRPIWLSSNFTSVLRHHGVADNNFAIYAVERCDLRTHAPWRILLPTQSTSHRFHLFLVVLDLSFLALQHTLRRSHNHLNGSRKRVSPRLVF